MWFFYFNYPNPITFADLRLYLLVFILNSKITNPPVSNPLNSEFLETQKYTIRWFLQAKVSLLPYNIYIVFLHDVMTWYSFSSVQFSSVTESCPTLCDLMNHSMPGLPVHHQHPEFTKTLVHWVSDAIQPSHPLSSPSPPAPNPSQHQSLFQSVSSSHEVAKVLEFQLQHHSLQRNPRVDLLQNGLVGSPCSPRDSQESSPTPQFKSINSLALSLFHCPTLTSIHDHRKNYSLD